ncbi:little elongation complex subunit 1 isoform X2 [Melanotaenia boesemani]|nr:little elongation complex subunit 1 isoform X2 [Melanotaenia boesemani]
MEKLKQENSNTVAENKKLEDQLKSVKELAESQSLENNQLKREKAAVEIDLLKTQTSLKTSQAQADKVDKLMEENTTITNMKDSLENQTRVLEDSVCKQKYEISQLTKEKILLERHVHDLQERLIKLERERCKDYQSTATQTSASEEPKVDKEKVRMLLQSLWACVEPDNKEPANMLHLPESDYKEALPSSPQKKLQSCLGGISPSASHKKQQSQREHIHVKATYRELNPGPLVQHAIEHQTSPLRSRGKKQVDTPKKSKRSLKRQQPDEPSPEKIGFEPSFDEIMEMFKPLLPCISPLPDLDAQIESKLNSMEMDDWEKKDQPELSEDSALEGNFLNTTKSLSTHKSPKSFAPQKESNVNLLEVTTQKCEQIASEEDLRQKELSCVAKLNDKPEKDGDKMFLQKDLLPLEEPASVKLVPASLLPSSSTLDDTALVEVVSLTKGLEPSCSVNLSSSGVSVISEIKNAFEEAKDNDSEPETKMDADRSLNDVLDATTATPDNGELPRESHAAATSEEPEDKQIIAFSKLDESAKSTNISQTGLEIEKSPSDSFQGSEGATGRNLRESSGPPCKDSEIPACIPSSSSDCMSPVFEERLQIDAANQQLEKKDSNVAQETRGVDATAFPSELNADNEPLTVNTSPLLKDEGHHGDQGCDDADSKTPSKTNVETINGKVTSGSPPSLTNSPELLTVDCKSLEKNTHFVCRQLSPTCLFPSVKVRVLESHPDIKKSNTDVNTEHIAANTTPVACVDTKDIIDKVPVKDLAQDCTDTCSATTLVKNASPTKRPDKCLESCPKEHEKQCSGRNKQENGMTASPAAPQSPEHIGHVRSKMGPPLPPVLTPLSTPQKTGKSINPRHAIGKLSFPSPMDEVASPTTPVQAHSTPNSQGPSSSLNSPAPQNGVPSSPLQFGSATPKHAVPVPGRLPLTALNSSPSSSTSPSQENSMRILDTMYPELSARARTLSILRGNVSLSISSSENGALPTTADSQGSGFKTISSSSTAFTKTEMRGEKRKGICLSQPENSKCPKFGSSSPGVCKQVPPPFSNSRDGTTSPQTLIFEQLKSGTPVSTKVGEPVEQNLIVESLQKIKNQCFDLLPVIQSHLYVGNLPKKPVLRDEEKEVISEICQSNSLHADDMVLAIQKTLKAEKNILSTNYMQALCRVYTGICRQKRDHEKARILAHSILTEDYPDSAKLILFMATTWPTFLSHSSSLCQAIHAITKLKAQEGLLSCLSAFLGWEKTPPCDIDLLISRTLSDLRSGANQSFIKHSRHGEDLGSEAWEQIFTLHLLCSHKKWKWTYENVMGKELWPLMNTWVTQPRDRQEPVSDMTVATVIRLTGRLGQLGLKENCVSSVGTVANVMNTFGRHGQSQDVPWEVQLAAVYCIYELSPCNPKQALDALAQWRGETNQSVPPAVTSCINQLGSICRQVKS